MAESRIGSILTAVVLLISLAAVAVAQDTRPTTAPGMVVKPDDTISRIDRVIHAAEDAQTRAEESEKRIESLNKVFDSMKTMFKSQKEIGEIEKRADIQAEVHNFL